MSTAVKDKAGPGRPPGPVTEALERIQAIVEDLDEDELKESHGLEDAALQISVRRSRRRRNRVEVVVKAELPDGGAKSKGEFHIGLDEITERKPDSIPGLVWMRVDHVLTQIAKELVPENVG